MKGTESFKQTIHSYLEQRASEDTLFAEKYHAVNRSIDDIVTYILNQVMKSECNGFDDDEIYSLAIHAAEEKDLEVGKPMECDVRVNHIVELSEEESRRQGAMQYEDWRTRPTTAFPNAASRRLRRRPPPFSNFHYLTSNIEHYESKNTISKDGVPVRQGHGTHRQESNQVGNRRTHRPLCLPLSQLPASYLHGLRTPVDYHRR